MRVFCPHCQAVYKLRDGSAGQLIQCNQCRQLFEVARPVSAETEIRDTLADLAQGAPVEDEERMEDVRRAAKLSRKQQRHTIDETYSASHSAGGSYVAAAPPRVRSFSSYTKPINLAILVLSGFLLLAWLVMPWANETRLREFNQDMASDGPTGDVSNPSGRRCAPHSFKMAFAKRELPPTVSDEQRQSLRRLRAINFFEGLGTSMFGLGAGLAVLTALVKLKDWACHRALPSLGLTLAGAIVFIITGNLRFSNFTTSIDGKPFGPWEYLSYVVIYAVLALLAIVLSLILAGREKKTYL